MVSPKELVDAAVGAKLDLIAVTDHDTMRCVAETVERGGEAGLEVVPGIEITTAAPASTHVMGWYVQEQVRSGMSLLDTVRALHEQDALVVIPHPFMPTYFASCQPSMLQRLLEVEPIDAIESMFTAPINSSRRTSLEKFIEVHRDRLGALVGGSDCHFGAHDLGLVVTTYEGDFRQAVVERRTTPERVRKGHVPSGLAVKQQWRSLIQLPWKRLTGRL